MEPLAASNQPLDLSEPGDQSQPWRGEEVGKYWTAWTKPITLLNGDKAHILSSQFRNFLPIGSRTPGPSIVPDSREIRKAMKQHELSGSITHFQPHQFGVGEDPPYGYFIPSKFQDITSEDIAHHIPRAIHDLIKDLNPATVGLDLPHLDIPVEQCRKFGPRRMSDKSWKPLYTKMVREVISRNPNYVAHYQPIKIHPVGNYSTPPIGGVAGIQKDEIPTYLGKPPVFEPGTLISGGHYLLTHKSLAENVPALREYLGNLQYIPSTGSSR